MPLSTPHSYPRFTTLLQTLQNYYGPYERWRVTSSYYDRDAGSRLVLAQTGRTEPSTATSSIIGQAGTALGRRKVEDQSNESPCTHRDKGRRRELARGTWY